MTSSTMQRNRPAMSNAEARKLLQATGFPRETAERVIGGLLTEHPADALPARKVLEAVGARRLILNTLLGRIR